jgi:STE24 endopeptidase
VHGDIWRLIGFGAATGFGIAWLLSRIAPVAVRRTSEHTGVRDLGDEASFPVLALLMTALGLGLMPVQAAFSRALERRADRFAVELTRDGEAYARAMEQLAAQSLADPDPPRPVVFMLFSHPPIAERIRTARDADGRLEATRRSHEHSGVTRVATDAGRPGATLR